MANITGSTNWLNRTNYKGREFTYNVPLDANDTLISEAFSLLGFSEFVVNIDTDTNCTLWIDLSLDGGITWDRNIPRIVNQSIGSGGLRTIASGSTHARVRVVNGSVAQTELRVLVRMNEHSSAGLTSSMNQVLSIGDETRLARVINDPIIDIAASLYSDRYSLVKFGSNPDVGTGAYEHIWSNGGMYPWPEAAETVRVQAGGNAADTAAGAGAQKVMIEGLDENWDLASEELTLAGASASAATTTTFIRVNRAYVTDVGTYGAANTGAIIIENTTSTNVLANIAAGLGSTQLGHYSVPANYNVYIKRFSLSVDASKPAAVRIFKRENADDVTTPFTGKRLVHVNNSVTGNHDENLETAFVLPEKSDVWFEALASSGGGATNVEVDFDIIAILQQSVTPQ